MFRADKRRMEPDSLFIAVFQHMPCAGSIAVPLFDRCVLIGRDKLLHQSHQSVKFYLICLEDHGRGAAPLIDEPDQNVLGSDHRGTHILCRLAGKYKRLLGFFCILCHLFLFPPELNFPSQGCPGDVFSKTLPGPRPVHPYQADDPKDSKDSPVEFPASDHRRSTAPSPSESHP